MLNRAVEICDLGGDGPPPQISILKLEVGSQFLKSWKFDADFVKSWKLEADFGKNWKFEANLEKIVSWKPILKILIKLETDFENTC